MVLLLVSIVMSELIALLRVLFLAFLVILALILILLAMYYVLTVQWVPTSPTMAVVYALAAQLVRFQIVRILHLVRRVGPEPSPDHRDQLLALCV